MVELAASGGRYPMALFTIYLCQDDGTAATFEMREAYSDDQALMLAELVLEHHPTAVFANVWDGERQVGRVNRSEGPTPPMQGAEA
jgi:hypothetical protein